MPRISTDGAEKALTTVLPAPLWGTTFDKDELVLIRKHREAHLRGFPPPVAALMTGSVEEVRPQWQ